ncbi:MAG: flagellar biosynthesis protein FliQ [Thermodesulfobacteriota bacterium]|jgi:flagellar biosynthetic protein FliQ
MSPDQIMDIAKGAIEITLYLSLPILGISLIVGLVVSLFQALTQIQEATLTFVPKIVATFISLLFLLPWMMNKMMHYTEQIIVNIPQYIR